MSHHHPIVAQNEMHGLKKRNFTYSNISEYGTLLCPKKQNKNEMKQPKNVIAPVAISFLFCFVCLFFVLFCFCFLSHVVLFTKFGILCGYFDVAKYLRLLKADIVSVSCLAKLLVLKNKIH